MYERILVPLDGSEVAETALPWVALIPSRRVQLVQIEPVEEVSSRALLDVARHEFRAAPATIVRYYLERVGEQLRARGREVEVVVARGDAAERIVEIAAEADLLVMTTHGRGASGRVISGNVADRVARHAPIPTLIVRAGVHPLAAEPPRRIVVPLDGSALAEKALPVAVEFGRKLALPLHLITVADPAVAIDAVAPELFSSALCNAALAEEDAGRYIAGVVARFAGQGVEATSNVRAGAPAVELLAALSPGDLIVMTTHGRGGAIRWCIGRVADKLVRAAPGPVLLVRADLSSKVPLDESRPGMAAVAAR